MDFHFCPSPKRGKPDGPVPLLKVLVGDANLEASCCGNPNRPVETQANATEDNFNWSATDKQD